MPQVPAGRPIPLIFARNRWSVPATEVALPYVALYPHAENGWNDFGHNFLATALVRDLDETEYSFDLHFMLEGGGRTRRGLLAALGDRNWARSTDIPLVFCSLLMETSSYRDIVVRLGFERALDVLLTLGDAVLARLEGEDQARLALIDSPEFHLSALRREDAYTALRRGARHLRRTPAPEVDDAATSFVLIAALPSASNRYVLAFDFEPDLFGRDRVAVLIGRNGVGKTQVLLALLKALRDGVTPDRSPLRSRPRLLAKTGDGMRPQRPAASRVIVFASTPGDDYPATIPPWEGIDYLYANMIGGRAGPDDALTLALVDILRDDHRQTFPVRDGDEGRRLVGGQSGRWALLKQVVAPMGLWSALHVPLRSDEPPDLPHLRGWEGRWYFQFARAETLNEERRLRLGQLINPLQPPIVFSERDQPRRLSSGEAAMFRFAAQAAASVETGSLLLFDEPETHLHPNFISDFAEILHILLTATRSIAVVATHSAYLVRETPSRRVHVLTLRDGEIEIARPRMQTYGATIDSISQAVFQDGKVAHQFQATLAEWLERQPADLSIEALPERFGAELNRESLSLLARLIERRRRGTDSPDA